MKRTSLTAVTLASAAALLLGASSAVAAPAGTVSTPQFPTQIVGSDTLNLVVDTTIAALLDGNPANGEMSGAADGLLSYNGLGSGAGENELEGSPTGTQPTCGPTDPNGAPDLNPGCQEISPMSRPMDSSICDDEESAGRAEGLAICGDGIVVITDNAGHQQFADSAASCGTSTQQTPNDPDATGLPVFPDRQTGKLRSSGTLPNTGYSITDWRDTLRVLYTGCLSADGKCTSNARIEPATGNPQRGCNGTVRQELINSWGNLFEGVQCAGVGNCTGLRQAYRRDDSSGTTAVFLELLGISGRSLTARTTIYSGIAGALTAIPTNFAFCDGGQLEGFWPDPSNGPKGDPIHKTCAAEDDLCGSDAATGTAPVVRAIRSPIANGFPTVQCTKGNFANVGFNGWNTSTQRVCPDGTIPKAGTCRLPFYAVDRNGDGDKVDVGDRDFNCMNQPNSRDPKNAAQPDGRSYNWVVVDSSVAGSPAIKAISGSTVLPEVATWRQNMNTFNTSISGNAGGPFPATVCQEADATRLIGCIVGKTTCTLGWAGREAASFAAYDETNEPVRLNGFGPSNDNIGSGSYPFKRDLYVNAIGGFENVSFDCLDRGGSVNFCADQVKLALEFYNMTTTVQNACKAGGYIPIKNGAGVVESRCEGANFVDALGGGAGCGAPAGAVASSPPVQARTACLPQ